MPDRIVRIPQSPQTCQRKVRYRSRKRAVNACVAMSKKSANLEPYECLLCGGWHIGHEVKPR